MCTFSPFLILFCFKLYFVEPPRDALDSLILSQVDLESLENLEQTDFTPFDPIMKRTEGSITDPVTNEKYKTTKGAPHVIIGLTKNEAVKSQCMNDVTFLGMRGIRSLAVAKTDQNGKYNRLRTRFSSFAASPYISFCFFVFFLFALFSAFPFFLFFLHVDIS